jgi:FkbM family methyltransferase
MSLREPLWYIRHDFQGWSRARVADLRLSAGRPFARVRVNGLRLKIDLRDQGIGRPLYVRRSYELPETNYLRTHLHPGMVLVDVGANIGYFTTLASRIVGPTGRVVAVEPDRDNYAILKANLSANRIENSIAIDSALGSSPGHARLYRSRENNGDHRLYSGSDSARESIKVEIETLDDLLDRLGITRVDFIKMDVQGYESHVLQGMKRTLDRSRNLVVLSEFWPSGIEHAGGSPADFLEFFRSSGFDTSMLSRSGTDQISLLPVRVNEAEIMERIALYNPDYPENAFVNLVFERSE